MKKHKIVLGLLFCVGLALSFFRLDVYSAETTSDNMVIDAGNPIDSGNRVWFFNVCGEAYASDFIAVESNGHWGLIDAGFRKAETIQDIDGTVLSVPMNDPETKREYYSCSVKGKNGVDAARYMAETLGVTHLDFIIISHAHLDHNGGIPEIAELRVKDSKGVHSLIDKNTICLKKKYWHIKGEKTEDEGLQDNLDEQNRLNGFNNPRCWQSQAFDYQAEQAVVQNGGTVVDISKGLRTSDKKQKNNNYKGIVDTLSGSGVFSNVKYDQGSLSDFYDDYLDMQFGTFQMRLYNLYGTLNAIDDNQNSIAVVISNGKK